MRNKLTEDKPTMFIDQYGSHQMAGSAKELREKVGGGRVSKMYRDTKEGTMWVGYVVGYQWFEAYKPTKVTVIRNIPVKLKV
jgi:hypothetical protein